MGISSIIKLIGGLAFFLFGMSLMGESLKKAAGNKMELILGRLAATRLKGVILGTLVTAIIQSSSATSVMVVSFVNSGIMQLEQGISVILGANIGTTVTGWMLTLAGVESGSQWGSLFSSSTIFAVVAIVGLGFYMMSSSTVKKNAGVILLSLSVLMSGMQTMSGAMAPLQESEAFMNALSLVSSPWICVILGILITAVVQSCSASIGILQVLSMNGVITHAIAIPTVIGMSIGACVPVLLSAIGANNEGKRTAVSYLYFNLLGGAVALIIYLLFSASTAGGIFLSGTSSSVDIAIVNTLFKVFAVIIVFPFVPQLTKLVCLTFRNKRTEQRIELLDERLLNYPTQAIEQCTKAIEYMTQLAQKNIEAAFSLLENYDKKKHEELQQDENEVDLCEDKLGAFIVRLNSRELSAYETRQTAKFLHCMMDLERISDHAENMASLALKLFSSGRVFSSDAIKELEVLKDALREIIEISCGALNSGSTQDAYKVEPLEEIVDALTEALKVRHIARLQKSLCTHETSFIFNDCINNMERVADHCSNIAVAVIELHNEEAMLTHDFLRTLKQGDSAQFKKYLGQYERKYIGRLSLTIKETVTI